MTAQRSLGRLVVCLSWLTAMAPGVVTAADQPGEGRARAQLVAGSDRIEPGASFLLGVRFDIEPGWHIYWRNPGGAGLATDVSWRLPDGFEVGELQWPLPIGFTQSDGIPGYGYEGSVVLAAEVRVPPQLDPSAAVVGAEVSWLACRDVCVLGAADLEAPLAGLQADPAFATWAERQPRPLDGADAPFSVTTTGGLADGSLSLWLRWAGAPLAVSWFPDPEEGLEVGEVAARTRGGLTRIDVPLRRLAGAAAHTELQSLIVVTEADGGRRGWTLTTDLER